MDLECKKESSVVLQISFVHGKYSIFNIMLNARETWVPMKDSEKDERRFERNIKDHMNTMFLEGNEWVILEKC